LAQWGSPLWATRQRSRSITSRDIELFTEISGDRNPIHYDPEFAASTSFGGIVVTRLLTGDRMISLSWLKAGCWQPAIIGIGPNTTRRLAKGGPVRRIAFLAMAVALIALGCSGEVETETFASAPTETAASDAEADLVEAITGNAQANPDRRFDDVAVACIAQQIVDEFGVDGLAELGVTLENPDLEGGSVFARPDAGRRIVDIGMDCIDLPAAILSFLPAEVSLPAETVECVADQLQTDTFRDLFADLVAAGAEPADILDHAAAQLPIASLLVSCLTPAQILEFGDLLN
jgi:hypothetical protein